MFSQFCYPPFLPSVQLHFFHKALFFVSCSPQTLDSVLWDSPKPKRQRGLCSARSSLRSASSRRVFVVPRWAKQTCVYRVTVAGRGRLVGVRAGALSLTLWNTTAVRLLPDSMLIVWFNSPMFNHERKRDYANWFKVLLCGVPSVDFQKEVSLSIWLLFTTEDKHIDNCRVFSVH